MSAPRTSPCAQSWPLFRASAPGFPFCYQDNSTTRVCPSLHPHWVNSTFSLEEGYLNIHVIMKKITQPHRVHINSYLGLCEETIQRPQKCRAGSARQCHRELFLFNFLFGSSLYVGHNDLKEQALTRQNQTSQNKAIVAGGGFFSSNKTLN